MIFKQFHLPSLGHASYLIGDEDSGEAMVLDPRRDVDCYFEEARQTGVRIVQAMNSHGHNDYLSGLTELVARQDIEVLALDNQDVGYAHQPVGDGDVIEIGTVAIEIRHTPGHTPEHLSLVIYDRSIGKEPAMLLSGGSLLVGDVGRPDLLGGRKDSEQMAKVAYRTLEKMLLELPDHLEVFPTHVKGSLCAGSIGSRLSTTLGYEKKTNPTLIEIASSDGACEKGISIQDLSAIPPYWRRMRMQNMQGVELLPLLQEPPRLLPREMEASQSEGAFVVDTRTSEAFGAAHILGATNLPLGNMFSTWAGTVVPEGGRIVLILDRPADLWETTWQLLRVGYELPVGWIDGVESWRTSGRDLVTLPSMTVHDVSTGLANGGLTLLDVRQPRERAESRIDDSIFITGAEVVARIKEIPQGKPVAVICGGGYRSAVMASVLKNSSDLEVFNVPGGMRAWEASGYPVQSLSSQAS